MAINFPSSPVDGQIYYDYTSGNRYIYKSALSAWKYAANNSLEGVANTQVVFNKDGSFGGSNSIEFYANTLYVSNVYVTDNVTATYYYGNGAFLTGVASDLGAANNWANTIGLSSNAYSIDIGTAGNAYALATATSIGTAGNNYSVAIGSSGNVYSLATATSIGTAGNNYTNSVGAASNAYATGTFVKLTAASQTITGDIAITGNLTFLGNAVTITSNNLIIGDSLIYLAANNYSGTDIVDIGFVANYGNTTGANVHTGLYRDHLSKEYYLFQGFDAEPTGTNTLIPYANNMVNAVLNADLITSNLVLGGANAIVLIANSYDKANAANVLAYETGIGANNWANTLATAGNNYALGVATSIGTAGNNYTIFVGSSGNSYALATATSIGTAGNNYLTAIDTAGNNYALGTATSIGTAGNNYTNSVGSSGNAYALATATSIGTAGNNYLIAIDTAGNNYALGVATSVGTAGNNYTIAVAASANNWANTKLANTTGITFNGDFNVSGNLSAESTTFFVNGVTNRVGIGRNDPGYSLDVVGTVNATALLVNGAALSGGATLTNETASTSTYYPVMTTAVSGSMTVANTSNSKLYFVPSTGTLSATVFNSLSDRNLKDNIENFDGRILIDLINPVSFNWKDNGNKSYGVIAQELEQVLPELVETNDQGVKSVSYIPLIAILVDVIKRQQIEIEEIKKQLNMDKE